MSVIQSISTKELRENFDYVKSMLASGQSLTLIYRSKPIAQIKPLKTPGLASHVDIRKLAGGIRLKESPTPDKLNKLYDRSTYKL